MVFTNDALEGAGPGHSAQLFSAGHFLDPKKQADTGETAREIVLLRVTGVAPLPMDGNLLQTKIENLKERKAVSVGGRFDGFAKSELQFGGLQCRILGTFYMQYGQLRLGSDIETFRCAAELEVYRPTGIALETIVNYMSPERAAAAGEEARRLGLSGGLPFFFHWHGALHFHGPAPSRGRV